MKKQWVTVCHEKDLIKNSGVCALVKVIEPKQIALFKVNDSLVYAIDNYDPFGQANVLYRGLLGDENGELYVASPLLKQRFSLRDGRCLDNPNIQLSRYETRIVDDQVQIAI
jgi:nitrite reductase (NADH) small subunit